MNMQLVTLDKFTRKEAFEAILTLKKEGKLDQRDIDMLVNHFAPALPKKAKFAEQWVALACGKLDVRSWVNHLHVVKGVAHGTDGHRMHWVKTSLPNGVYCPKTLLPVIFDDTVPDFDRLKKDHGKLEEFDIKDATNQASRQTNSTMQFKVFGKFGGVNAAYLTTAINGGSTCQIFVDSGIRDWGVQGVSEFGDFRIMGVRF